MCIVYYKKVSTLKVRTKNVLPNLVTSTLYVLLFIIYNYLIFLVFTIMSEGKIKKNKKRNEFKKNGRKIIKKKNKTRKNH